MTVRDVNGPTIESLGVLIREGRVTTEGLWCVPDDSAGRALVGTLLDEIRAQAIALGQSAMLPVCDTVSPVVNAAPTPHSIEILLGGFDQLESIWRKAQPRPH
jgi:hypothetical protein